MGAISRRVFVAGTGAAAGIGALAGFVGAGACGMLAGGAALAEGSSGGAGPVELDATVVVGGASFRYPGWWSVSDEAPDEDSVRLDVVDQTSGSVCGRMTFTVGSPAEGARSVAPDAIFDGFARSESMPTANCLSAVWGLERIDQGDDAVPMARALCVRSWIGDGRPSGAADLEFGYLYMALAPDWTLLYAEALANLASFETVASQFDSAWASAVWPAPVTMETMDAANEEFAARALRRGGARNATRPFYNRYWKVSDFYCPGGGYNGNGPVMPSHTRYLFTTPGGIEEDESSFVQGEIPAIPETPVSMIWSMRRTDSSGVDYLRSTVEVEGYGVVDVAHYDEIGPFWYIADSGTPVLGGWFPNDPYEGWSVYASWDGEPWQYVAAG